MDKSTTGRDIVLTVATHDEGYLSFFKQSCERFGIEPTIIGHGVEWKGFGTKFNLMKEWANDNVQDDDRLLIVDCYDLIFLRSIDPLFRAFVEKANDKTIAPNGKYKYMYVASEPLSWPYKYVAGSFYGLYQNELVNSGSFMAYGKLLKEMFNDPQITQQLNTNALSDDQQLLISYLSKESDISCTMDRNRRFIVYFSMRVDIGARLDIIDEGAAFPIVYYKHDQNETTRPYVLHRSGNGSMIKILQELRYNTDGIEVKSNFLARVLKCHVPNVINTLLVNPVRQVLNM